MCGISGFIGKSQYPEATYELMTAVFGELEARGTDASGFWGAECGDGKVCYHKAPIKSSDFIKGEEWKNVGSFDLNLLLCHARSASTGVGIPAINRNNHPFVSTDKTIALVHNGRIPESEYEPLSKKYETMSRCDSEVLLRIFEAGDKQGKDDDLGSFDNAEDQIATRLRGLRNIWSHVTKGHMAVAIGERLERGHRRLWLFRNQYRSLCLIDLRKYLGQVFFCSTPEIFRDGLAKTELAKDFLKNKKIKMVELPTEEIWVLRVSNEKPVVDDGLLRKFEVHPQGFVSNEFDGNQIKIAWDRKPVVEVVTRLDKDEDIVPKHKVDTQKKSSSAVTTSTSGHTTNTAGVVAGAIGKNDGPLEMSREEEEDDEIRATIEDYESAMTSDADDAVMDTKSLLARIDSETDDIEGVIRDISTVATNRINEGSMPDAEAYELLRHLEQIKYDLKGTLKLFES